MQSFSRFSRALVSSPSAQRKLAVLNLVAQVCVALGGSIVRVTGSGLGCPTWPQCAPGSFLPVADPELGQTHQWIEFGNRLLGGVVGLIGALVLLAALLAKPRRRRHILLALAMPLGVVAQAMIGGFTVWMELEWWTVMLHFLPSPVLVWLSVLLVRAVGEGDGTAHPLIPAPLRGLHVVMTAVLAGMLISGTLVTAAGPHAGDADTARLDFSISSLAQFHADFLLVFLGMLVALGFGLRITGALRQVWRAYWLLVTAVFAQGALGMIQYWLGVPEVLVSLHVLGSLLVVAAMAGFWGATRERTHSPAVPEDNPDQASLPA